MISIAYFALFGYCPLLFIQVSITKRTVYIVQLSCTQLLVSMYTFKGYLGMPAQWLKLYSIQQRETSIWLFFIFSDSRQRKRLLASIYGSSGRLLSYIATGIVFDEFKYCPRDLRVGTHLNRSYTTRIDSFLTEYMSSVADLYFFFCVTTIFIFTYICCLFFYWFFIFSSPADVS